MIGSVENFWDWAIPEIGLPCVPMSEEPGILPQKPIQTFVEGATALFDAGFAHF